jgi:hypothetical protein
MVIALTSKQYHIPMDILGIFPDLLERRRSIHWDTEELWPHGCAGSPFSGLSRSSRDFVLHVSASVRVLHSKWHIGTFHTAILISVGDDCYWRRI